MVKIIISFIVAIVMLVFSVLFINDSGSKAVQLEADTALSISEESFSKTEKAQSEKTINVNIDGTITPMEMEEYLVSVVAGEVYPTYMPEALKAQAVAARTYLIYKINGGGCSMGGDICTNSTHCQAYKSIEKMKSQWGEKYDEYSTNIRLAVSETAGEVVTYQHKPICALYHSSSVESTEDCSAVFGGDRPYLVSVSAPLSSESSEYSKDMTFTRAEFCQKINDAFNTSITKIDIKIISYTSAGRVSTVEINGKSIKATALRTALGLRSTAFTFVNDGDTITFTMLGYGHGVGLSQAGAQEMARSGSTYKQILTHFYVGTEIEKI